MNTFLTRLNAVFAFTVTVLALLTLSCFLTTAFNDHKRQVQLGVNRVILKKATDLSLDASVNDLGSVSIELKANLEDLFNWNVKQLFIFLTAEYTTASNAVNQVVLWDKIIQRGESAKLVYTNLNTKYYFWDDGLGLKGNKNVSLTLSWNVIPNAGRLDKVSGNGSFTFSFPNEYFVSKT